MAKVEAGYVIKTPVIKTDARGALGLLRRLSYDEIIQKKDIKRYLRKSLNEARKEVQSAAKGALANDPRKAYLGVKVGIYRKTLGGNVSLYNQRPTRKTSSYEIPRGGTSGILRNRKKAKEPTISILTMVVIELLYLECIIREQRSEWHLPGPVVKTVKRRIEVHCGPLTFLLPQTEQ